MSAPPVSQHSRICIVDDDPPERKLLRLALESEGYGIAEASNGQEALRLLRRSPHRFIVLLDLHMPGLSGTEVLRQVATEPSLATRHTFILISAWPDRPPELTALLNALSVPVVSKPFDLEELLTVIAQASKHIETAS